MKEKNKLIVFPNPTSEKITVHAIALQHTFGLLDILDEKGMLVKHITRQVFKKGRTIFETNVKALPAGNYKMLWRSNELFVTTSFVILK